MDILMYFYCLHTKNVNWNVDYNSREILFFNIQIDGFNQEAANIYFQSSCGNLTVTDGIQPAWHEFYLLYIHWWFKSLIPICVCLYIHILASLSLSWVILRIKSLRFWHHDDGIVQIFHTRTFYFLLFSFNF